MIGPVCSRCGKSDWTVRGHRLCLECRKEDAEDRRFYVLTILALIVVSPVAVTIFIYALQS